MLLKSLELSDFRTRLPCQTHDKKRISNEIIEKFLDSVEDYYFSHGIKNFYIEWFGGEPLLSYNCIVKVTDRLNDFFKDKDVEYHYGATTNGSLLSAEKIAYLLANKFDFFQITLDGSKETHDKTRPLLNGEPTWDNIFNNLLQMQEFNSDFHVSIRVNYNDETLEEIEKLFEIISKKLDERFTMFFHSIGKWGGINDNKLNIIDYELNPYVQKMLMDEVIKYGVEPRVNYKFLDPYMRVCYAGKPYNFTVGTDGKLRKCNEESENLDDYNVVGTIENGKIEIDVEKWGKFVLPCGSSQLDQKCKECLYLPICFGQNCPKNRVQNKIMGCPHDFDIISEIILNKYKYFSKYKKARGSLNHEKE